MPRHAGPVRAGPQPAVLRHVGHPLRDIPRVLRCPGAVRKSAMTGLVLPQPDTPRPASSAMTSVATPGLPEPRRPSRVASNQAVPRPAASAPPDPAKPCPTAPRRPRHAQPEHAAPEQDARCPDEPVRVGVVSTRLPSPASTVQAWTSHAMPRLIASASICPACRVPPRQARTGLSMPCLAQPRRDAPALVGRICPRHPPRFPPPVSRRGPKHQ
jgi:hypothetical protein